MRPACLFCLVFLVLLSCNASKNAAPSVMPKEERPVLWWQKDFALDGIPGISLEKWYRENTQKVKGTIIVAVIDMQLDLGHEDLQGQIWVNKKEIRGNKIDDDHNGYVDDINGWNFLGTKDGGAVLETNFEEVRMIRKWEPVFKGKTENQVPAEALADFKEYKRAADLYEYKAGFYGNWRRSLIHNIAVYPKVKDTLKHFFPKEDYTYARLDSLYQICKTNDKSYIERRNDNDLDLGALVYYMMVNLEVNEKTLQDIKNKKAELDSIFEWPLNLNYNDRERIGDNPDVLEKGHGNANVGRIKNMPRHSTEVSAVIAANRNNAIGIKGFSNRIKIMPVVACPSGDEQDKDVALAIRYAVDNGAKVINMSFGKNFSMHADWVKDAFHYAESHNVLLVHCAGNNGFDADVNPFYPTDSFYDGKPEICGNFINVGSISNHPDENLVSAFSNYGKQNVDIFAPGDQIYTATPFDKYAFDSGTSLAGPMVSATAAMIWLYHPDFTAGQIKQIIMDSGNVYNLEVVVPGSTEKKPFSELSKSGRALNFYQAMKRARIIGQSKSVH